MDLRALQIAAAVAEKGSMTDAARSSASPQPRLPKQCARPKGRSARAIAVFSRLPSKTSAHVGFVVGADKDYLSILGENQSDSISVSRVSRKRLLDFRYSKSAGKIGETDLPEAPGELTTNEA